MITDNNRNYNQEEENFTENNQSYVDQYQKEHVTDGTEGQALSEEETAAEEQNYLDSEFSDALDQDDFENDFDENQLEEEDSKDENEDENYSEEQIEEPETFADDGYKID